MGAAAAIVFGLGSALSWGAGDFIGGYASRRLRPAVVILVTQAAGLSLLILVAWFAAEPFPAVRDLLFGAAGGLAGVVGIAALYRGLSEHKMGTIAPLSALLTAALPICAGIVLEGFPAPAQFAGILVAAPAIYWVSREDDSAGPVRLSWPVLKYPLFAGLGFGLFFILIDRVTVGAVFWPLVATRTASISAVVLWMLARRDRRGPAAGGSGAREGMPLNPGAQEGMLPIPGNHRGMPPHTGAHQGMPLLLIIGGVFDAGGNVFFALATQAGRLDIASVLASLYPAGTVFLAALVLKERLSRTQRLGVAAALAAVVLFSI